MKILLIIIIIAVTLLLSKMAYEGTTNDIAKKAADEIERRQNERE